MTREAGAQTTFGWWAKACKCLIKIPGPSWPNAAKTQFGGAFYTRFEPILNVKEPDRRRLGHPAASHCSSTLTPVTPLARSQWAHVAQQGGVPGYSWPPSLAVASALGTVLRGSSLPVGRQVLPGAAAMMIFYPCPVLSHGARRPAKTEG